MKLTYLSNQWPHFSYFSTVESGCCRKAWWKGRSDVTEL